MEHYRAKAVDIPSVIDRKSISLHQVFCIHEDVGLLTQSDSLPSMIHKGVDSTDTVLMADHALLPTLGAFTSFALWKEASQRRSQAKD